MIVGRKFVWLHFPKSGGHAVDQALRAALHGEREIAFDVTDREGWHDSLRDREQREPGLQLADKTVICGFRRLPYWILSRVHYEASRPPYLSATRAMLCAGEFFHQNGQVGRADDYIHYYADPKVERWIRLEHLAQDFTRHFGDILGSRVMNTAVRKVRRIVNGTSLNYVRDLSFYFTPAELAGLYAANPAWARLERQLYGDLLTLTDQRTECYYFGSRKLQFLAASPPALQLWGKEIDEVVGKHLLTVFPLARGGEPYAAHVQALRTMRDVELETVSPTLARPVRVKFEPRTAGLKVTFQTLAS